MILQLRFAHGISFFNRQTRQTCLGFDCRCIACLEDWPPPKRGRDEPDSPERKEFENALDTMDLVCTLGLIRVLNIIS